MHVVTRPTPPFFSRSKKLRVHQVLAWRDNLIWLIEEVATGHVWAVDGPECDGVLSYCAAAGLNLVGILNTHIHSDHIGINRALAAISHQNSSDAPGAASDLSQARTTSRCNRIEHPVNRLEGARAESDAAPKREPDGGERGRRARLGKLAGLQVVGAAATRDAIPGLTLAIADGDEVILGASRGVAMLTEGHINGHISYLFEDLLFCGDTLFAGGCGFLADGPPAKMQASLHRLAALPADTKVCCAHEYTQDNLRFAWSIDADNSALAARIKSVWLARSEGACTVPSTIGEEVATNPFLLGAGSEGIARGISAFDPTVDLSDAVSVFAATRRLKDSKAYRSLTDDALPL